jgi:tetrathionate reductase subunit B
MSEDKKGLTRKEFLKLSAAGAAATAVATTGVLPANAGAANKGVRWGFVVDLDKCIGCKGCHVACKSEFDVRLGVFLSSVTDYDHGKYPDAKRDFLPWLCNHCENPPCVPVCPVDPIDAEFNGVKFQKRATYKRPDGVVLVDQDRCIGCGECIRNCPYEVRSFDPGRKAGGDPAEHPAQKCTFCQHRLAKGVVPSCVNTCTGRARFIGNLNDPNSEVSALLKKNKAYTLLTGKGTKPQVFYIGKNAMRINDALKSGADLRREANSDYQLKV